MYSCPERMTEEEADYIADMVSEFRRHEELDLDTTFKTGLELGWTSGSGMSRAWDVLYEWRFGLERSGQ